MEHVIITNYKVFKERGTLFTDRTKENPNKSGKLYMNKIEIKKRPSQAELDKLNLEVDEFDIARQKELIQEIVSEAKENKSAKDVLLFVHGYVPFKKSHKLQSLYEINEKYITKDSKIFKILYISWPGFGWPWGESKEAYEIGRDIFDRTVFFLFHLSHELKEEGGNLHFLAQSWGNRVLSGFCSKIDLRKRYLK